MARISLIEAEQASPEVKEIYEKLLRGKPGNFHKAFAHRPESLKNFVAFYASVGCSLESHHLSASKRTFPSPLSIRSCISLCCSR